MSQDNKIRLPSGQGGLTRYFDEYKSKITIKPGHVIVIAIIVAVIFPTVFASIVSSIAIGLAIGLILAIVIVVIWWLLTKESNSF